MKRINLLLTAGILAILAAPAVQANLANCGDLLQGKPCQIMPGSENGGQYTYMNEAKHNYLNLFCQASGFNKPNQFVLITGFDAGSPTGFGALTTEVSSQSFNFNWGSVSSKKVLINIGSSTNVTNPVTVTCRKVI